MSKKVHCPRCGSKRMIFQNPYVSTTVWECKDCGYVSSISIEDGNLEKQLKETRKMEKISQNLLWKR